MPTSKICDVEPFRYQATPQIGDSNASTGQINDQFLEDYLNRLREAICGDIQSIIDECCNGGPTPPGGVSTFLELTDTPASYAGSGGDFVAVNAGATALEFVAAPSGGGGGLHKSFSTSEQATDRTWIGGETIYQKTINVGTLPNTTTKNVAHGITGLAYVILFTGWAMNATESIPIPFVNTRDINSVQVQSNSTNLRVTTGIDRTAFTTCYVTMFYVKTP
jgi:hypothetical protein